MAYYYQPFSMLDVPFGPPRPRSTRSHLSRRSPLVQDDLLDLLLPLVVQTQPSRERARGKGRAVRDPPAKWAECVPMAGFSPGEVAAEVRGDKVVIVARRETGDGDNADTVQVKRTVPIPGDVEASRVVCNLVPGRFVLVEGPRSRQAPREVPVSSVGDHSDVTAPPAPQAAAAEADVTGAKAGGQEDSDNDSEEDDSMVNVLKVGQRPPPSQLQAADPKPANFELTLDMKHFQPSDVTVSREGRRLVIDASREEASEFSAGKVTLHRELALPQNADPSRLRCFFREDGVLMVSAPFTQASDVTIPVQLEGAEGEKQVKKDGEEERKEEKVGEEERKEEKPHS